jgi:hypothetical protein
MLLWVSSVSLGLSVISFLLFAICILFPRSPSAPRFDARAQGQAEGLAKAVEALSKLVDSFSKAGPAALTLTASMVFMVISLIAAKA